MVFIELEQVSSIPDYGDYHSPITADLWSQYRRNDTRKRKGRKRSYFSEEWGAVQYRQVVLVSVEPLGLLSDPMGVSLLAGFDFGFGFGYGFSHGYKSGSGVTAQRNHTQSLLKKGGYLLSHLRSTIGTIGLNFSVRNGKRWNPNVITT